MLREAPRTKQGAEFALGHPDFPVGMRRRLLRSLSSHRKYKDYWVIHEPRNKDYPEYIMAELTTSHTVVFHTPSVHF